MRSTTHCAAAAALVLQMFECVLRQWAVVQLLPVNTASDPRKFMWLRLCRWWLFKLFAVLFAGNPAELP